MSAILTLLGGIVVVAGITVATGYFVAQEFAYMAVDRSRLRALSEAGDPAAMRALAVTRRTSFMLSGAQLGITVTGLLVGYVAEPLIGRSVGTLSDGIGVPTGVAMAIGAIVALLFSTVIQMLFGELFPKNLAIAVPDPVALRLADSTTVYLSLFGWLIWIFDRSANLVLRLLGIEPVHDVEHAASARDLEHIVADSRDTGALPEELSKMIDRILDFPTQDVEHAMIPRSRVATVSDTDTVGEVRDLMSRGHSRYPVLTDDEPEAIVGVVRLADLLTTDLPRHAPVTALVRQPLVLSNLMRLPDALRELTASRNQLACVVDEYGGFAGVITLEDLAEELVGEISDEHDPVGPLEPAVQAEGVWLMAGDVHVDEAERTLDVDLPVGDYETIAGLVIAQHGALPTVGTMVDITLPPDPALLVEDEPVPPTVLHAEVLDVAQYVPAMVRLTMSAAPTEPATDDDDGDRP
ncbi:MAG: magnesium and cobalt exporter, family [Actinomycetota bacterium]|nr:magnesium and cobalt exporter, family [Actinomycetota bacterium]